MLSALTLRSSTGAPSACMHRILGGKAGDTSAHLHLPNRRRKLAGDVLSSAWRVSRHPASWDPLPTLRQELIPTSRPQRTSSTQLSFAEFGEGDEGSGVQQHTGIQPRFMNVSTWCAWSASREGQKEQQTTARRRKEE